MALPLNGWTEYIVVVVHISQQGCSCQCSPRSDVKKSGIKVNVVRFEK